MKWKYLTLDQVLKIHAYSVEKYGGSPNVLDVGKVGSAVEQPKGTFGGQDLYPTLAAKAAALGYSLCRNHGFADGNKRTAAMAVVMFLSRNGYTLKLDLDEEERVYLGLAAGTMSRDDYAAWIESHMERKRRPRR